MYQKTVEIDDYEARVAAILRALTERRAVGLEDYGMCLEGPLAYRILIVVGLERITGRAFVRLGEGSPIFPIAYSDIYHCMDCMDAVRKLMDEGALGKRVVN